MALKQLKALRKKHKMTQKQLANAIGIDNSSVCKYETGDVLPSHDILIKIAELFNVSTDYILDRSSFGRKRRFRGSVPKMRKATLRGSFFGYMESSIILIVARHSTYSATLSA